MINLSINLTTAEAKEQLETSLIIIGTEGISTDALKANEKMIHILVRSLPAQIVDEAYSFANMFHHELNFSFEGTLVKSSFETFAEFVTDKM